MSIPTLSLEALSVGYRSRSQRTGFTLGEINAGVDPGRLVCVLGPNGSGKSTLLRTIAGFLSPVGGEVLFEGRPVSQFSHNERARFVSVVLTEPIDAGMLSARDLVALGRYPYTAWFGRLTSGDHEAVEWALDAVGALELAARTVMSLSDGERQKIMIARALAQEPRLIVLDEPTAFLDLPRKVEVMKLLGGLAHETGCSVLLSTHELEIAQNLADQLWLIQPYRDRIASVLPTSGARRPHVGSLSIGSPEDLALSGDFEHLFASNGITYDQLTGRFLFGGHPNRRALLRGTGMARRWTERALNRVGIEALEAGEDPDRSLPLVTVQQVSSGYLWTLTAEGTTRGFDSIAALLEALAP